MKPLAAIFIAVLLLTSCSNYNKIRFSKKTRFRTESIKTRAITAFSEEDKPLAVNQQGLQAGSSLEASVPDCNTGSNSEANSIIPIGQFKERHPADHEEVQSGPEEKVNNKRDDQRKNPRQPNDLETRRTLNTAMVLIALGIPTLVLFYIIGLIFFVVGVIQYVRLEDPTPKTRKKFWWTFATFLFVTLASCFLIMAALYYSSLIILGAL